MPAAGEGGGSSLNAAAVPRECVLPVRRIPACWLLGSERPPNGFGSLFDGDGGRGQDSLVVRRVAIVAVVATVATLVVIGVSFAVAANNAVGTGVQATVTPSVGGPRTTFVIRFTARAKLGVRRGVQTEYVLSAFEGNRHPIPGCTGSFDDAISHGRSGQRVVFREGPNPRELQGPWCPAGYRAKLRLDRVRVRCSGSRCRSSTVVAHVRWRVRRP